WSGSGAHRLLHSSPYTTLFRSREPGADPLGLVEAVLEDHLGEFRAGAAGKADEAVVVGLEQFLVDARDVVVALEVGDAGHLDEVDRKSTRLNSSHLVISYAVFC